VCLCASLFFLGGTDRACALSEPALSLGVNCRSLGVWLAGAATAGEPKDKKMIFERIRANGGFLALNVLLKNQLMQVIKDKVYNNHEALSEMVQQGFEQGALIEFIEDLAAEIMDVEHLAGPDDFDVDYPRIPRPKGIGRFVGNEYFEEGDPTVAGPGGTRFRAVYD